MIEIKNLKKQFGSLQVLKGINLTIHDGEVVSIIGPSGSGKSTLLRCINLLEQPTSGQVIIDGQDITARGVNIQKVREEVGMVFQHFNLFQNKNVMQNMIYAPMKVRGIPKEQAEQKAMQLLERVGLADKAQAYPSMLSGGQQQRCIVHMIRNTLKFVNYKDRKQFATDLKSIYLAPNEQTALKALEAVNAKWTPHYKTSMKRWYDNWDAITPIFKFSLEVRRVIYTTNAIESLNSSYRRINRQRSVFPSPVALMKALYLATTQVTRKWTMPVKNWGGIISELSIMYPDRIPE